MSESVTAYQSESEAPPPQGRFVKNLLFHALNVGSTFVLLAASSILTAHYLGPQLMGQYGLLTTFSTTIINVGTLGLVDATSRFVAQYIAQNDRSRLHGFVRFALLTELIICLVASCGVFLLAGPLSQLFGLDGQSRYFGLMALLVFPAMFGGIFTSVLAGLQRYDLIALVRIGTTFPLLAMILLVVQLQLGISGLLWANIAVNLANCGLWGWLVIRVFPLFEKGHFSLSDIVASARFSFSLMLTTLFNLVVWQRSEVFFITIFRDSREVGLYTTAFVLSNILYTLVINVLHVLIPALAGLISSGDMRGMAHLLKTSGRLTALLATPLAFGGIVLVEPLIGLLYGRAYLEGAPALRILFVATLASCLGSALNYTLVSNAATVRPFLLVMFGLSLLSVGLDFLIIPQFGFIGAAICNTIVQMLAPLFYNWLLHRFYKFNYLSRKLGLIISTGFLSLLIALVLETLIGGALGLIIAAIAFSLLYLGGIFGLKAIYRQDLETFLKLAKRLPQSWQKRLGQSVAPILNRLEPEPAE